MQKRRSLVPKNVWVTRWNRRSITNDLQRFNMQKAKEKVQEVHAKCHPHQATIWISTAKDGRSGVCQVAALPPRHRSGASGTWNELIKTANPIHVLQRFTRCGLSSSKNQNPNPNPSQCCLNLSVFSSQSVSEGRYTDWMSSPFTLPWQSLGTGVLGMCQVSSNSWLQTPMIQLTGNS